RRLGWKRFLWGGGWGPPAATIFSNGTMLSQRVIPNSQDAIRSPLSPFAVGTWLVKIRLICRIRLLEISCLVAWLAPMVATKASSLRLTPLATGVVESVETTRISDSASASSTDAASRHSAFSDLLICRTKSLRRLGV